LKRVLALRPCTYNRIFTESETPIPQEVKDENHIGFIAQEVQETNPHCIHEVDENNEKRLTLQYQDYIIHLCGGMQEQQKQIEQQRQKIEEQSATINTLTANLAQLAEHVATLTTAFNEMKKNSL
jgi:methyl-accepting chemotaxis protein